jgi:hypothetical protein
VFGFGDVGVDAFDEGRDDGGAVRVVPVEFLVEIAAKEEEAIADVAFEFAGAEDFGDGAGGLAAPDFELKEAVARDVVALGEEEVVFVFRVDVGDAPVVLADFDGLSEAGKLDGFLRGMGGEGGGQREAREEEAEEAVARELGLASRRQ